ncbi:MAG: radical SAM protein [Planctomycetota bacterium]
MDPQDSKPNAELACNPAFPHLAVWDFAGLLLTYWCSARCAFCYVNAGPEHAGAPDMPLGSALRWWRELTELAAGHGRQMRIHLAGGEPFRDWVRLAALLRAARDAGLPPVEKIETNAFWATDDAVTRARLELLAALGVERLVVSSDVFHQEFVPFERVRRCAEIARDVFGRAGFARAGGAPPGGGHARPRVVVRWWDFYQNPVDTRGLSPDERGDVFRRALLRHRERLNGRAAVMLAPLLPLRPAATFAGQACAAEVLQSRHVHIDPGGHVFPGTCAGVILGRAASDAPEGAGGRSLAVLREDLRTGWPRHPVLGPVVGGGPVALLERVRALGYVEKPGYADKCHLCADIRQWLARQGLWREAVGPREWVVQDCAPYGGENDAGGIAGPK